MDNTKKPVFIHSQELEKYSYPLDSMFVTQRAAKTRELLSSLGLLESKCGRESAPVTATKSELKKFHSEKHFWELPHKGFFCWIAGFELPSSFSRLQYCFLIL